MLPYTSLIYSGADKVIAHWVPGFHGYHQFFLREILFLSSLPFPTHTLLKKKKKRCLSFLPLQRQRENLFYNVYELAASRKKSIVVRMKSSVW